MRIQMELHPYLRQEVALAYFKEKGIHVTAYSPLGSPDSAAIFQRHLAPDLLGDPIVREVAEKLGKNVGQVQTERIPYTDRSLHSDALCQILIRWGLQRDTSVLVKSVKPERIKV